MSQLARLAVHCMAALDLLMGHPVHAAEVQAALAQPRMPLQQQDLEGVPGSSTSLTPGAVGRVVAVLVEFVIASVAPETWAPLTSLQGQEPAGQGAGAAGGEAVPGAAPGSMHSTAAGTRPGAGGGGGVEAVLARLLLGSPLLRYDPKSCAEAPPGLFRQLATMLLSNAPGAHAGAGSGARPLSEQLITQLLVRLLGLKQGPSLLERLPTKQVGGPCQFFPVK